MGGLTVVRELRVRTGSCPAESGRISLAGTVVASGCWLAPSLRVEQS